MSALAIHPAEAPEETHAPAPLIDASPETLAAWSAWTQPIEGARPLGVLRPRSRDEAMRCLEACAKAGVALYPVSRGRGWGLGSRRPVVASMMLDLSGLDRILDIDLKTGTARIEPGVTFTQLQTALKAKGLAFHVPMFGGPADASVLANALERGDGCGAAGDRYAQLDDVEIGLATGERFHTGPSRFGPDFASPHARPAGPLLQGLFSQSGFGVALSGRIGLAHTAYHTQIVQAELGVSTNIGPALAALRGLVRSEVVAPYAISVWDAAKRATVLEGAEALWSADRRDLRQASWCASVLVASDHDDLLHAKTAVVIGALASVARDVQTISDRDADGRRVETPLTGFNEGRNVTTCYAARNVPPELRRTPDADRCGFVWHCTALPFQGEALADLVRIVSEAAAPEDGIVPALGIQAISASALQAYVSLAWDRDAQGADASARTVHDAIQDGLAKAGYLPFRLAHASLAKAPRAQDDWASVVARLRDALDPNGILASGRVPDLG
ncbi:MAG: FAD-binding oxidoreductase [Pseudomonadota bacterium]